MIKFFSLSSGSNGNCYFIGNEHTGLLIDAGVGPRTIKKRLAEHDIDINNIEFVLVTHDHIDHIKSLGIVAQRFHIPVYATEKLHKSLDTHFCTRSKLSGCVRNTVLGMESIYKGVKFTPFSVPHDATQTVGYFIDFYGVHFVFLTDVGEITDEIVAYCRMAKILIIESNYDIDMLVNGSYAPMLKNRILNGNGHLSNDQTASAIKRIYNHNLEHVFLCHLSENNNTPQKAFNTTAKALASIGVKVGSDIQLVTLPRMKSSLLYTF